jgi:hypothetical protein
MRRALALLALLVLAPVAAMAKNSHPMAGCGLIYAAGVRDNKTGPQIVASLFNGFFGTQTFGITSGTSGCTENGLVAMAVETEVFAEVNFENLRRDMAAGRGDYVTTLADLVGVKAAKREDFFVLLKDKYAVLIPSARTTSAEMLEMLRRELALQPDILA